MIENEPLSLNSGGSVSTREFTLTIYEVDRDKKELRVGLQVVTPATQTRVESYIEATFWVGFYDFPMIDNTRLSDNERCAVVVEGFDDEYAKIALVYFPGSHASLREKPYYEDVLKKLVAFPG